MQTVERENKATATFSISYHRDVHCDRKLK